MTKVPVPFTDQDIDTDEGTSALMTVVLLIAGFSIFAMASSIGDYLAQRANQGIAALTGVNPATGDSGENGVDII